MRYVAGYAITLDLTARDIQVGPGRVPALHHRPIPDSLTYVVPFYPVVCNGNATGPACRSGPRRMACRGRSPRATTPSCR
jgi:2-keto-4-pentenoate hydratase/2-oxohepta-3-ene-1,7-dioic acid hydratase in catechol pathway